MNLIQILFCLLSLTIIIYSSLINYFESKLPPVFSQIFRYGKFASATKSRLAIEVPKSWFKHFYLLAVLIYTYIFVLVTLVYLCDSKVPEYVHSFLNHLCGEHRYTYTSKTKVYLAVCLMTAQVYRRFYDTQKVSVFGEKSKMNLSHYLIGLIHYPGTAIAIICEAPLFADSSEALKNEKISFLSLSISDKLVGLLFMIAWKHQYICTQILANLRKSSNGKIVDTKGYKIPRGDWFEYLSAPHQTAEILMYSCIMWLLWTNITWFYVFVWVLVNQVETILLSHWWYQEKFEDFPKKRKALIPFIY